jgi:cytochrome c553
MTIKGASVAAAVLSLLAAKSSPAEAADAANGRKIAAVKCGICHGEDGQSKLPEAPNLAGQIERYLVEQVQAFKTGARKNDLMTLVVKPIPDNELADIAAFYAGIEVKVGKVPGE